MKVYEYNKEYKVYYSANDRFTKKVSDNIYEVYHITIIEDNNFLTIKTLDLSDVTHEHINKNLSTCGLRFTEDKKIVQKTNPDEIIEANPKLIDYTLVDRLSISGLVTNTMKYEFDDAKDLNELLLEHNIPHSFDMVALSTL